jgi:HK97 family phage major capsid protein
MIQILNARKKAILDQQEQILNTASEAKVQLTAAQNETFETLTRELDATNSSITRYETIDKGKREVSAPANQIVIPSVGERTKYSNCTAEYASAFWKGLSTRNFTNAAALGEGGTPADGSFLVPAMTDPSIPALAVIEASARRLSRVITTQMDIKLPFQASKSVAAAKAESNSGGTNAFATNVPTFGTTTLSAFTAGNSVPVSWELLQDVKALSQFLTADLNRAVFNYEEAKFIGGSGTNEPQGYLTGATQFETAPLNINAILDLESALKAAYYGNASFLFNRSEFNRLRKAQLAENQFQSYITNVGTQFYLDGFPVQFSSAMPAFVASPATSGAVLFGDFSAGFTIGDRISSDIFIKVLDQPAALNGQTIVMGWRRTDQRCILQEAVQLLTTNA